MTSFGGFPSSASDVTVSSLFSPFLLLLLSFVCVSLCGVGVTVKVLNLFTVALLSLLKITIISLHSWGWVSAIVHLGLPLDGVTVSVTLSCPF